MRKNRFMFATGIENSYPSIQLPDGTTKRVDEMEKAGHYKMWREDFWLVKEMGIEFLRYGPPYYSTHVGPGQYDWSFTDEAFNFLRQLDITPIVDLCHFGVPDWVGNFQNPDWPYYFEEYARAFAQRFPYIELYTPVNEIFIAAMFSAQYGWWNERLTSDKAFVTALKHLCKANTLAMRAILEVQPDATFIQSESNEYFHAEEPTFDCIEQAKHLNEKRFLPLDLTYGHHVSAKIYDYLVDNGMTREEYHWFAHNEVKKRCVMGNDYYWTNEHMVHADGRTSASGEIFGYYVITKQYFERYRLPVMHTETNIKEPNAAAWLKKQWANAHLLAQNGVPLVGFTWYSLTDQVDWDTALREDNGNVNELGLYDLERKIRPVGEAYKRIIQDWKEAMSNLSFGLHQER
jgi:beta-glucosidase/6-phospho-beta-glucosidase/beta-galactosidase